MKVKEVRKVESVSDAYKAFKKWENKRQEHFLLLTLDASNHPIQVRVVTVGILNQSLIAPRELFYHAIRDNACSIILAHNHPSGDVEPSNADKETTKELIRAGKIMRIRIADHIIIGHGNYHSMRSWGDVCFN